MILLTGASGYIGQKVLQQLLNNHHSVAVLTRNESTSFPKEVEVIVGDLTQPQSLKNDFSNITHVIHLAAVTHGRTKQQYYAANLTGTSNLVQALPATLQQFVYVSTNCAVPGAGWYGESKLAAEKVVAAQFPNATFLRVADVYGGQGEKSLEKLLDQILSWPFFTVGGLGQQQLAPVHVDDVVSSIVISLKLEGHTILTVSGEHVYTFKELIQTIAEHRTRPLLTIHIPVPIFHLLIQIIGRLGIGDFYPDQVQRLVAKKPVESSETWQKLGLKPKSFQKWLDQQIAKRTQSQT